MDTVSFTGCTWSSTTPVYNKLSSDTKEPQSFCQCSQLHCSILTAHLWVSSKCCFSSCSLAMLPSEFSCPQSLNFCHLLFSRSSGCSDPALTDHPCSCRPVYSSATLLSSLFHQPQLHAPHFYLPGLSSYTTTTEVQLLLYYTSGALFSLK